MHAASRRIVTLLQFEPVAVVVLRGMAHQHFEAFIDRGERGVRYFR
jgi:hypothetical protein